MKDPYLETANYLIKNHSLPVSSALIETESFGERSIHRDEIKKIFEKHTFLHFNIARLASTLVSLGHAFCTTYGKNDEIYHAVVDLKEARLAGIRLRNGEML